MAEIIDTSYPYTIQQMDMSPTPIQQFFSGSSIFITGGTGFLGKSIIYAKFGLIDLQSNLLCFFFAACALIIHSSHQQAADVMSEHQSHLPVGAQKEGQRRPSENR